VVFLNAFVKHHPLKKAKPAFGCSYGKFSYHPDEMCPFWELPQRLASDSFRRGGASMRSMRNEPVLDILALGRWASLSSASRYLRKGEIALLQLEGQFPHGAQQRVATLNLMRLDPWKYVGPATALVQSVATYALQPYCCAW
jgi:hypothetical protein